MLAIRLSGKIAVSTFVCGLLAFPALAQAQVSLQVGLPIPELQINVGSPLVYVGPGVWVLPNSDEEVFYNGGWYWARSHGYWYRSHGRRGGWGMVNEQFVPQPIRYSEPGHYRGWQAPEHARSMAPRGWEERRAPQPMQMQRGDMPRGRVQQQEVRVRSAPVFIPTGRSGDGGGRGRGEGQGGGRGEGGGHGGGEGGGHGGGHGGGEGGGHGGGHGRGH